MGSSEGETLVLHASSTLPTDRPGTELAGSIIAPEATVLWVGGSINGNVVKNFHQREGAKAHNFVSNSIVTFPTASESGEDSVDIAKLKAAIKAGDALLDGDYTEQTVTTLGNALSRARSLLTDGRYTQDEIDKATEDIISAIDALEPSSAPDPDPNPDPNPDPDPDPDPDPSETVDNSSLLPLLRMLRAFPYTERCTEETATQLTEVYEAAIFVVEYPESEEAVLEALQALQGAIDALEYLDDYMPDGAQQYGSTVYILLVPITSMV